MAEKRSERTARAIKTKGESNQSAKTELPISIPQSERLMLRRNKAGPMRPKTAARA